MGHEDFDGGVCYWRFWGDSRFIGGTMDLCAAKLGAVKRANYVGRSIWNAPRGPGDIEQPVIAVHFSHRVRGTVMKNLIEVFDFLFPFTMWALLTLWEEKRLARVKTAMDSG
jgi:hypothetical protein